MAAMARLNRIWRSNTISFPTKFKLYKSLVASILLYGLTAYGIEFSTEKSKIMTNSINNIRTDISMNGQKLEEVTSFKYL